MPGLFLVSKSVEPKSNPLLISLDFFCFLFCFFFRSVLLFPTKIFLIRKIISFVLTSKEFRNSNFIGHNYAIKLINLGKNNLCKNSDLNDSFGTSFFVLSLPVSELLSAQIVCSTYFGIYIVREEKRAKPCTWNRAISGKKMTSTKNSLSVLFYFEGVFFHQKLRVPRKYKLLRSEKGAFEEFFVLVIFFRE